MKEPVKHNDDRLRHMLDNYGEMPSEKVWKGIEAALDKNKKRRPFFWLFFIPAGTVSAAVILLLFHSGPATPNRDKARSTHTETSTGQDTHTPVTHTEKEHNENSRPATPNPHTGTETSGSNTPATSPAKPVTKLTGTANTGGPGRTQTGSDRNRQAPSTRTQTLLPTGSEPAGEHSRSPVYTKSIVREQAPANGNTEPGYISPVAADKTTALRLPPTAATGIYSGPGNPVLRSLQYRTPVLPHQTSRRLRPFLEAEASAGAIWYNRQNIPDNTGNSSEKNALRRAGFYSGASLKGGFLFGRYGIFSAGAGYEYYGFSSPYALTYSGTTSSAAPDIIGTDAYESYGNVYIAVPATNYNGQEQTFNGRLQMRVHNLFFPVNLGFSYTGRRFSAGITAGPALHILLKQSAGFRNEDGTLLPVSVSPASPFNLSLGIEPVIAYRAGFLSVFASGTFRYYMVNAINDPGIRSRPYRASGQLGLRLYLPR